MKKLIIVLAVIIFVGCDKEVRRKSIHTRHINTRNIGTHEDRLYIWEGSDGKMHSGYFTNPDQIIERIRRTKGL